MAGPPSPGAPAVREGAPTATSGPRARRPATTTRLLAALLAASVAAAPGCRRATTGTPSPGTTAPAPAAGPAAGTEPAVAPGDPAAPPGTTRPVAGGGAVYLLTEAGLLAPVWRAGATTPEAALRALLVGAPDPWATAVPAGTRLRGVAVDGPLATVDLAGGFDAGGGSASVLARLAQVVFTVTAQPPVERVAFRLDGRPVDVVSGEGIELGGPVGRDWFADAGVVPPVLVEHPAAGQPVRAPLELAGTARGRGATAAPLRWRLERDGRQVAAGTVTVPAGGGPFRQAVAYRPVAAERLEVVVEAEGEVARVPFSLEPPA